MQLRKSNRIHSTSEKWFKTKPSEQNIQTERMAIFSQVKGRVRQFIDQLSNVNLQCVIAGRNEIDREKKRTTTTEHKHRMRAFRLATFSPSKYTYVHAVDGKR